MTSELFDEMEWITISEIDIGRVEASKMLFTALPEFALPVNNAEWDYAFKIIRAFLLVGLELKFNSKPKSKLDWSRKTIW